MIILNAKFHIDLFGVYLFYMNLIYLYSINNDISMINVLQLIQNFDWLNAKFISAKCYLLCINSGIWNMLDVY